MKWFRNHWFDIGGILIIPLVIILILRRGFLNDMECLLWANLAALWLHQLEEYRFPGTFPLMLNKVMFRSDAPDRFPLNTNTSVIINVGGWIIYFFAALFAEKALWLAIIAILVSAGNFIAHALLFNIRGKSIYNAGMLTSWFLFLPLVILFFIQMVAHTNTSALTWIMGIAGGIIVNSSIIVLIKDLADRNTLFIFEKH